MTTEPENELRFVPKEGESFHTVDLCGKVIEVDEWEDSGDLLAGCICFRTADQAQQVADLQKLMYRLAQIKFELEPYEELTVGYIALYPVHGTKWEVVEPNQSFFPIFFDDEDNAQRAADQLNKEGWRI